MSATTPPHTQERPRVDVGVLTWNTADVTPRALRTLLDSDQGCDITLLVRDNASSDGTPAAIASLVPEAHLDAGDANLGFSAGVNTLIRRSRAEWFFLLNPDAWPLPGAIGRLVRSANDRPRSAAIVPRLEDPDGALQHSTHAFPSLRLAARVAFAWDRTPPTLASELFFEGAWMHDYARKLDWAHGAAMLFRRSALEEIGGFDERFFIYAEDLEWCWRARKKGWDIWFEPDAIVRHIANVSGEQRFGRKRTRAHIGNSIRFYQREHGIVSAAAWWLLITGGGAKRWLGALARRDRARERYWRRETFEYLVAPFTPERRPRDIVG